MFSLLESLFSHKQSTSLEDYVRYNQSLNSILCVFICSFFSFSFLLFNMRIMDLLNGKWADFLRIIKKNNEQEKRNKLSTPNNERHIFIKQKLSSSF